MTASDTLLKSYSWNSNHNADFIIFPPVRGWTHEYLKLCLTDKIITHFLSKDYLSVLRFKPLTLDPSLHKEFKQIISHRNAVLDQTFTAHRILIDQRRAEQ